MIILLRLKNGTSGLPSSFSSPPSLSPSRRSRPPAPGGLLSSSSSLLSRSAGTSSPRDPLISQRLPDPLAQVPSSDLRRGDPAAARGPEAAAAADAKAAPTAPSPPTAAASPPSKPAAALAPVLKPQVPPPVLPRHLHDPIQHAPAVLHDPLRCPPRPAARRPAGPARQRRDLEGVEAAEDARVVAASEAEVVYTTVVGGWREGFFFQGSEREGREGKRL